MSLWRPLTRGLRVLSNRRTADRDIDDEAQHYLDEATAAFAASGLSPDEARRAARLEIGSVAAVRDQVRASGWEDIVGTFVADLRYAGRRLKNQPGFAAVSVLTLALGIGATTAIFSAVNPILFQPLPYPHADRVMMISDHGVDGSPIDVTFGTFREVVDRSRALDAAAVMKAWQPTITGVDQPERVDGQRVSASYFRALGVGPALGHDFDPRDDRVKGPNVVMLNDGLWRRRFGADPGIVGREVTLNDTPYTVVGVMPGGFENVLAPSAEAWALMQYDVSLPTGGREWGHHLRMVGRTRSGVTLGQARQELDAIAKSPSPKFPRVPWASIRQGFIVDLLQNEVTRAVRPALLAVLGAVVLLLVIACVNVTNLLLARGAQRRSEFAMRAALGAGRGRIVRQLLTESVLLAAVGGVVGMAVAELGIRALVAVSPAGLPRVGAIRLDGTVLAFAIVITTVVGLLFGLVPAMHASRDLQSNVQHASNRTAGTRHLTRRMLVIAEVALALVLLVSAGLLLRSLQRLFAVAPGFEPSHLLTMQVQTASHRFDDGAAAERFFEQALDEVRRVPGVRAAAFTSQLPLSGDFNKNGVQLESAEHDNPNEDHSALRYAVSDGYFDAIGIPLRSGRVLDRRDRAGAPVAVLINESFARRRFPSGNAIGQHLHLGSTTLPWYTVVGVVGDVKQTSLAVGDPDAVYIASPQWYYADRVRSLVVRAGVEPAALVALIRQAIWSIDKDQPVVRVALMDEFVAASGAQRRFALILFEAFGIVALALAATGLYGVLSGGVTERMREIGVRAALGASRSDILGLVVRQGMALTTCGVSIGLGGAFVASRALITLLFGISRLDATTYAGVVALLFGVSAIACWMPAWRAARIDPSITLRAD